MKSTAPRKYRVPVGWLAYTTAILVIGLILTFPYDSLHAMLLQRLSEKTGLDIRAERWSLQLPAGMEWVNASIQAPGLIRLGVDQIQVQLSGSSLLRGQPVIFWSSRSEGPSGFAGQIKGELSLTSWLGKGPAQALGSVEHLDLSRVALPFIKKGTLRGRFERRWADLSETDPSFLLEGIWYIEVSDLELEPLPIGPQALPSIVFSSLSGRLDCHAGRCRLESLRGEGQDTMFTGEGELLLQNPSSMSRLTVIFSVVMTDALREQWHLTSPTPVTPGLPQKITISGPLTNLQILL